MPPRKGDIRGAWEPLSAGGVSAALTFGGVCAGAPGPRHGLNGPPLPDGGRGRTHTRERRALGGPSGCSGALGRWRLGRPQLSRLELGQDVRQHRRERLLLLKRLLGHHLPGEGLLLLPEHLLGRRICHHLLLWSHLGSLPCDPMYRPGHLLGKGRLLRLWLKLWLRLLLGKRLGHPLRHLGHLRQREGHMHLGLWRSLRDLHLRLPGLAAPTLLLWCLRRLWHIDRHGGHARRRSGESHTARRHEGWRGNHSTSHVVTTSLDRFG